jgi:CRP-like cAMP-binding protein
MAGCISTVMCMMVARIQKTICEVTNALRQMARDHVYMCGDNDEMAYFIESEQIKLLMLSPGGKECLLAIHAAGDILGELRLSGLDARLRPAEEDQTIV